MRLLLALLVFVSLQSTRPFNLPEQPRPNGLARIADLSFLAQPGPVDLSFLPELSLPWIGGVRFHGPGWFDTVTLAAVLLGLLLVWGRGLFVVLPALALLHTLPWTLANSQGFIHHGNQLLSMVLWAQSLVAWWWLLRGRRSSPLPLHCHLIFYSQGVVAVSYLTCALTKIVATKGLWLVQSHHIATEVVVGQRREYYRYLEGSDGIEVQAAEWLLTHPFAALVLFNLGWLLELLAPLALLGRRRALAIGLLLILFHRSVWMLMRLSFETHEWLLVIFFLNLPFWIWWALFGLRTKATGQVGA